MTEQITLEEALKLVSFEYATGVGWRVHTINGDVNGYIYGDLYGDVNGNLYGDLNGHIDGAVKGYIDGNVEGDIHGDVKGDIHGDVNGREWEFVETPEEKLQRLIKESGNQELIDTFNQLEDN